MTIKQSNSGTPDAPKAGDTADDETYEGAFGIHLQEDPEDKARRMRVAKARGDASKESDAKDVEFHDAFKDATENKTTKPDA